MKIERFSHRVLLTSPSGNILGGLHAARAARLIASGDARVGAQNASGRIGEIVLTGRLFPTPRRPLRYTDPRNRYLSRSSQDTNVARGTNRSVWLK